ncbi:MAG: YdcF family protein [Myxococcales bacterium]
MDQASPKGCHAIVVFGAAVDPDGRPRRPLVRRLRRALAEAAADPRALVVVSGGRVRGRPAEAPAMRNWLVAEGLDPARIIVEPEARSTSENARHCAALIARRGFRRVTLVTERYHMLRARFLLVRALTGQGPRIELRMSAAPDGLDWIQLAVRWFGEFGKIAGELRRRRPR